MFTQVDVYDVVYTSSASPPKIFVEGSQGTGALIFLPNGAPLPADSYLDTTTPDDDHYSPPEVTLYYHQEDLGNIIELLERDRLIFLFWNGVGQANGLTTLDRNPGE